MTLKQLTLFDDGLAMIIACCIVMLIMLILGAWLS